MYEDKNFEDILNDMISYVADRNPDIDTREDSLVYTALAPIALELESVYHEANMIIEETFMDTASKEYLVKHGNQLGLPINEATYGHFEGEFDVDVEIGSRFNLDEYNYTVITKLSEPTGEGTYYKFELVCETEGSEPNAYLGDLTPITYVANLTHAVLTGVILYGEDEEDTEVYRYRVQTHTKNPPVNGNVFQYNEWLDEYDGVGKYKVTPCWNGINTVKLTISNAQNKSADTTLIGAVQNYFDPPTTTINDTITDSTYPQGRGMGNGKAPIGAIITVDTVSEVPVIIECTLTLKEGYSSPVGVVDAVDAYLNAIAFNKTTIGYMPISAEIYNAESVQEIVELSITIGDTVMSTTTTPFIESVTISNNQVAVLDTENSTWEINQ